MLHAPHVVLLDKEGKGVVARVATKVRGPTLKGEGKTAGEALRALAEIVDLAQADEAAANRRRQRARKGA